jgi:hypothetical protein
MVKESTSKRPNGTSKKKDAIFHRIFLQLSGFPNRQNLLLYQILPFSQSPWKSSVPALVPQLCVNLHMDCMLKISHYEYYRGVPALVPQQCVNLHMDCMLKISHYEYYWGIIRYHFLLRHVLFFLTFPVYYQLKYSNEGKDTSTYSAVVTNVWR